MKKRFAVEILAVAVLTAIFTLFEMGYIDPDRFADDIFDHTDRFGLQTGTAPYNHPVNIQKAGKDQ
jgi:hypothetical protein